LQIHQGVIHGNLGYNCSECDYKTSYTGNLKAHIKRGHSEIVTYLSCTHCQFKTKYKQSLQFHADAKHSSENYVCTMCDFSTRGLHLLKGHMKRKHVKNSNSLIKQTKIK
jgi:RNase P subunit RPR2